MRELMDQLKREIIEEMRLEDIEPEDIGDDMPLFVEGLGLDSIDALSMIVILEKKHGVKLEDPNKGKDIMQTVRTLAEYITAKQSK